MMKKLYVPECGINNNAKKIRHSVDDFIESDASLGSKRKIQSLKMFDEEK